MSACVLKVTCCQKGQYLYESLESIVNMFHFAAIAAHVFETDQVQFDFEVFVMPAVSAVILVFAACEHEKIDLK